LGLDVINDSGSEVHRNWVCSAVTQALGDRLRHGLWVLTLCHRGARGLSVVLTNPDGVACEFQLAQLGRSKLRDLEAQLQRAIEARG
jgi:hypothetical protein